MSSSAVTVRTTARRQPRRTQRRRARKVRLPDFTTWAINSMAPPAKNILSDNKVFKIQQIIDYGTVLTSSNVTSAVGGQNFQLNSLPQVASMTAIFDQYRIAAIETWLQPNQTNNGGHTCWVYSAIDYDSGAAPASLAALQQYSNVKETSLVDGHYHKFVPHVAFGAYAGAFTSYGNVSSPWLDSNSPTIQHYGLVFGCSQSTDNGITFNLQARFHLEFKNVI